MAAAKISIALDPVVAEGARALAAQEGLSLSAWLNDAAARKLRLAEGRAAVREYEAEFGAFTEDELADARAEAERHGIGLRA